LSWAEMDKKETLKSEKAAHDLKTVYGQSNWNAG